MKGLIITLCFVFCLTPCFAGEVEDLTLKIEKLTSTRDYAAEKAKGILQQYGFFKALERQVEKELGAVKTRLKMLEKKTKKQTDFSGEGG